MFGRKLIGTRFQIGVTGDRAVIGGRDLFRRLANHLGKCLLANESFQDTNPRILKVLLPLIQLGEALWGIEQVNGILLKVNQLMSEEHPDISCA